MALMSLFQRGLASLINDTAAEVGSPLSVDRMMQVYTPPPYTELPEAEVPMATLPYTPAPPSMKAADTVSTMVPSAQAQQPALGPNIGTPKDIALRKTKRKFPLVRSPKVF